MSSSLKEANRLDAKKYESEFSAFKPIEPQQETKGLNPDAIKDQENPFSSPEAQNAEMLAMGGNPLSLQNQPLPLQAIPEEILNEGVDLSSPGLKLRKAFQEQLDADHPEVAAETSEESSVQTLGSTSSSGTAPSFPPIPNPPFIPPSHWNGAYPYHRSLGPVPSLPGPPPKPLSEMTRQEALAYLVGCLDQLQKVHDFYKSWKEMWDDLIKKGVGGDNGNVIRYEKFREKAQDYYTALEGVIKQYQNLIDTLTTPESPFNGFMPIIVDLRKLKFTAGKPISIGESASMAKMLAAILSQLAAIIGLASKGRSDNQERMMNANVRSAEGLVKSSATALKELERQLDIASRSSLMSKIMGCIAGAIVTIVAVISGQFYLAAISAVMIGLSASDTLDKIVDKIATALIENCGYSEEKARLVASLIVTAAVIVVTIGPSAATSLPAAAQAIGKAATSLGEGLKQALLSLKNLLIRAFTNVAQNTAQTATRSAAQVATTTATTAATTATTTAAQQTTQQGFKETLSRFGKDLYKDVFKNTQGVRLGIITGASALSSTGFIPSLAPYLKEINDDVGEALVMFLLQLLLMIAEMMAGSGLTSSAKSFNLMRGLSTLQAAAQMGQSGVSLANMKIQTDLAHVEQEFSFYQAMSQFFEKMASRTNTAFQSDTQNDSNTIKALLEGINRFLEDRNKAESALVEAALRG